MSLNSIGSKLGLLIALPGILKLKKSRSAQDIDNLGARLIANTKKYGSQAALVFEGHSCSWLELNRKVNRLACALKHHGVSQGDCVSLLMENRIEFVVCLIALNKLGATAALINTNLTGRSLQHCISAVNSTKCIVGEERASALEDILSTIDMRGKDAIFFVPDTAATACPKWATDLDLTASTASEEEPLVEKRVTLGDTLAYIFTSGTTGLPKAAVVSNGRYLAAADAMHAVGMRCNENDCIYLCLPMYHSTALLIGLGSSLVGATKLVICRKFSVSNFLADVRQHQATHFVYIGEVCRYLVNSPASPDDANSTLRVAMGNGLRPDIWTEFKQRFGIERVAEFYGASEGNTGFVNILNKDKTIGMTPGKIVLAQYDIENDVVCRDEQGLCSSITEKNKPGLLLTKITDTEVFEGYTNKEASEKKVIGDVQQKGDRWFNTGDLIKQVDVGFAFGIKYYQLVDRIGDTFRWKGENVSTNEVAEIINSHPQIDICNVYGVEIPGTDGRAGMAAISLSEDVESFDFEKFSDFVNLELPSFARLIFIRIISQVDTTGTFKLVKTELRTENYNLKLVNDAMYFLPPKKKIYEPICDKLYQEIAAGKSGY